MKRPKGLFFYDKELKMKKIIIGITILFALSFGIYYQVFGKLTRTNRLQAEAMNISQEMMSRESESGIINIALFGLDQREHGFEGDTRSDAIKIVSIDTKHDKIKMTSIQRDLLVLLPDEGLDKLNHAYWIGGPELAIRTLNQNLDLDVTRYVSVNYDGIEQLIDYVGGVEVELMNVELNNLNENLLDLNGLAGWVNHSMPIEEAGMQTLSGRQAIAYMRIRKVGSDYARMRRQTKVMTSLAKKMQALNYTQLLELLPIALSFVETNLQNDEILSLLPVMMKVNVEELETYQLPTNDFDETISTTYKGYEPVYLLQDYVKLASDAHENIYGYYKDSETISHQHDMIHETIEGL